MTRIRSRNSSMIDDRRGAGRGRGMGIPMGIPMGGKIGGGLVGVIVLLAVVFIPQLIGGNGGGSGLLDPAGQGASGDPGATCDSEQEQIVCGATVDVQTYWESALPAAFGVDYVVTRTVFFSGATQTGCGPADSRMGPFYCPADGLVYFDLDFLDQLQNEFVGSVSDLASQYIVAHEYGHHVQNVLGTSAQVTRAQRQDPANANEYSVALELQADCYAGVWVHDVAARGLLEDSSEIGEALDAAAGVGDDRIQERVQGRSDPETFSHGTSAERQQWFLTGFETGDPAQCDTFTERFG